MFSIANIAGYCRGCRKYLCSQHLELQNVPGMGDMTYHVACKSCGTAIKTGPEG